MVVETSNPDLGTTATTDGRIALREILEKGSDTTFFRGMIGFAAQRLMELEAEGLCGAAHGERSSERLNQRNGHRERDWQARVGTVELRIPKLRKGSHFPAFLEPRRTADRIVPAAVGVNADGCCEVLGMAAGASEVEAFRLDFLRGLTRRGLRGVGLATPTRTRA